MRAEKAGRAWRGAAERYRFGSGSGIEMELGPANTEKIVSSDSGPANISNNSAPQIGPPEHSSRPLGATKLLYSIRRMEGAADRIGALTSIYSAFSWGDLKWK
jgi:hypothetical protein